MSALMDHVAVVWMALVMAWPVAVSIAALPLLLILLQLRRKAWGAPRRKRAALGAFVLGSLFGGPLAFILFGGSWGDLRYWLDVGALLGIIVAIAAYAALLAYLIAGFGRPRAN